MNSERQFGPKAKSFGPNFELKFEFTACPLHNEVLNRIVVTIALFMKELGIIRKNLISRLTNHQDIFNKLVIYQKVSNNIPQIDWCSETIKLLCFVTNHRSRLAMKKSTIQRIHFFYEKKATASKFVCIRQKLCIEATRFFVLFLLE